ncbi:beta family protein [Rheinheimera baltica]|uniref:beta family protein n=1 Tax=Rheinheimera baltica TaxID=67576 RepID=UPI00273E9BC5|nr:beta family protein [Rheinheimera baltica]MDP5142128.1 beta family protein [Rheinheimera baltica]
MNPTYFPIMKAMAAEFTALSNTKSDVANLLVPLFEFPQRPQRKAYTESTNPNELYISDTCKEISNVWAGRPAMFDTFHWNPSTTLENGEHLTTSIYNQLRSLGITAVPVVGYDRWSIYDYQLALKSIISMHTGKVCIRLDHHAFEDSAEPDFLKEIIDEMIDLLELEPANCHVLLDFEDVYSDSTIELFDKFDALFDLIKNYNFGSYSIAGCSLPKTIDMAVSKHNSCGSVLRKEMLLWKNIRTQYPNHSIGFGDYAVRGPSSNAGFPNPHTNGKIRYTKENEYFVARGQAMTKPPKGKQHWALAEKVINSGHYLGPTFSWGDNEIMRCKNQEFPGGNAQVWIKIDTNHHLAFVVSEIFEYERALTARALENNSNVRA